ncbi:Ca2+-transporting ATPase [Dongia mobilis]|uniref:Ca2+-transporting ATPase n=1 Tax=Dongia mobilis TaxID=578943 RepID=A0A4R6WYC3_9PROT|nr:cation-transporting P-type ATPase [Dongia mobilis]TDQ84443.1 Ca2+-transporting ATPase [Dongia mobilis]
MAGPRGVLYPGFDGEGSCATMINRDLPDDIVAAGLHDKFGLSAGEVTVRRARYGSNDILAPAKSPWRQLLADTARDPMIWFLAGMGILYASIGEFRDALILAAALLPLLGLDAYLHHRTQASTLGLSRRLAATCRVTRDGSEAEIAARDLVPGDLARLLPGDLIPADAVIVHGNEIQADESSVTGESFPVRKAPLVAKAAIPVTTGENWLLAGTRLLAGTALVRVVHTGSATLYGQIARAAILGGGATTPLQAAIRRLVGMLLAIAVIFCFALAAIRLLQGYGAFDAIVSALTLAIAALPEEFPVVFTFYLGLGVYRLAQRKALVRRAVAVENIGRITCICSDKTGTLTEGRLDLAHCEPAPGRTAGELAALAAAVADPASTDPLDQALAAGLPAGLGNLIAGPVSRIAAYPFTEARRRESAIFRQEDGTLLAIAKGAPETILAMCADDDIRKAAWMAMVERYAEGGHKVIACATQRIDAAAWNGTEPERGFGCIGLLAFEDRLREGVAEAVNACRAAGIRVVVVTGDHPLTARAIGAEIGLGGGDPVVVTAAAVLPAETAGLTAASVPAQVDVIARATPDDKLRLVRALQRQGEIVAVTGDGINDVPALQAADIGIAMGERGTQSAREIAAIVLLDDNFRTITQAIAEGRQLFANLTRSFLYLIAFHIAFVSTAALIPLLGFPLLYLPIHIVWLELIIHPTALLVFQQAAGAGIPVWRKGSTSFFFDRLTGFRLLAVGAIVAGIVMAFFILGLTQLADIGAARALALTALISAGAAMTLALQPRLGTIGWVVVLGSLASAVILVQVPSLAGWMHLEPLPVLFWLGAAVAGMAAGALTYFCRPRPREQVEAADRQQP